MSKIYKRKLQEGIKQRDIARSNGEDQGTTNECQYFFFWKK